MDMYEDNFENTSGKSALDNIGEDESSIFYSSRLKIDFRGVYKSVDYAGAKSVVIRLYVSNLKKSSVWLCHSLLLNDATEFLDDYVVISPGQNEEIYIWIEDYEFEYSNDRFARFHFMLEDGRRRILGRGNSLCVEYNMQTGKYQYHNANNFYKKTTKELRKTRDLDIGVNKVAERRFFADDWSYMYYCYTVPIVISNFTGYSKTFLFETISIDDEPQKDIIGMNTETGVWEIDEWRTEEINIVVPRNQYYGASIDDGAQLFFAFTDEETDYRYINAYTFNVEIELFKIDYSLAFVHDDFR